MERSRSTHSLVRQVHLGDDPCSMVHRGSSGGRASSWSADEERALMMGLDMVKGPHWSQILQLFGAQGSVSNVLADRTQVQLKDKARNLKLFWYRRDAAPQPGATLTSRCEPWPVTKYVSVAPLVVENEWAPAVRRSEEAMYRLGQPREGALYARRQCRRHSSTSPRPSVPERSPGP